MGLSSVIQNATKAAVNVLGDIPKKGLYKISQPGEYDAAAGVVDNDTLLIEIKNGIVLTNYKSSEIDGINILSTDQKAVILQSDIPQVDPKKGHAVVINKYYVDGVTVESIEFNVIEVKQDPSKAAWFIQLRLA